MILATKIQSEKGKEILKTANEYITITLTENRKALFDIRFTGEKLEVIRYWDSSVETINYDPYKPTTRSEKFSEDKNNGSEEPKTKRRECTNCGEEFDLSDLIHAQDSKLGKLAFCRECWNPN